MKEELLTTKELAEFLRLNEKKIYQLIRDGNVPHVKITGKWLFPKKHILRWIDEQVEREKDILIAGSDDILMSKLLNRYSQENFPQSLVFYSSVGSFKGIEALSHRKVQACCIHLLDLETGEYNLPFLRRHLLSQEYVVTNLWHRSQGLIVKKDNPHGIKNLEDIVQKKLRYINRNQGSGTRLLLEYFLKEKGFSSNEILGFENEVNSHLDVALKVFFGEADAGLGIEYVSHLLSLGFIPLKEERFDLVVPKELWHTKVLQTFVSYIDQVIVQKLSGTLPGYNLKDTGKIIYSS